MSVDNFEQEPPVVESKDFGTEGYEQRENTRIEQTREQQLMTAVSRLETFAKEDPEQALKEFFKWARANLHQH